MAKQTKTRPRERQPARTQAEQIDRELAARAIQKRSQGEIPTRDELAALRRWEAVDAEERRWRLYEAIPKKDWQEMSGRQPRTLNEQAKRYGIPFGGRIVNLPDVVFALHDFLAKNACRLGPGNGQDGVDTRETPTRRRRNLASAELLELDLAERKGEVLRRTHVHEILGRVSSILRAAGDTLQRRFGQEAHTVLEEALDDAEHELRRCFGDAKKKTDRKAK